jgi:hypothetical protein
MQFGSPGSFKQAWFTAETQRRQKKPCPDKEFDSISRRYCAAIQYIPGEGIEGNRNEKIQRI